MTREDPMRYARRWMRSVGAFYLALLAPLTPPVVTRALPWLYPGRYVIRLTRGDAVLESQTIEVGDGLSSIELVLDGIPD